MITGDPADTLEYHKMLAENDTFSAQVSPHSALTKHQHRQSEYCKKPGDAAAVYSIDPTRGAALGASITVAQTVERKIREIMRHKKTIPFSGHSIRCVRIAVLLTNYKRVYAWLLDT